MAMTATIALAPSTIYPNQTVTASVTISNSGASAVTINSLTPAVSPASSASISSPYSAGAVVVPASGSQVITFTTVFAAPGTYTVGAAIDSSDGSVFAPSAATATVSNPVVGAATVPTINAALTSAHIFVGSSSNIATDVAMSGDASMANTGALTIANLAITNAKVATNAAIAYSKLALTGAILNTDISATAAIAYSKLAALTSGNILVGSAGNVATSVAMSGDASIIASGAITVASIGGSAPATANTASTLMERDASGHSAIGVMEIASCPITDKASGGSIGSAATTVDISSVALVNQTTAAQTLTLPSPTSTTPVRAMYVMNIGSADFTMLSQTVAAGTGIVAIWTGSAWSFIA